MVIAHMRARLAEQRDGGRHEVVGERRRRRDMNRADLLIAHVLDQPVDAVDAVEDPVEIGDQHARLRGRLQAALAAHEQGKAGDGRALAQHHADGRLGDAERDGRPRDRAPLADGADDLELAQGEQHKLELIMN